jgi:hypothetical protein
MLVIESYREGKLSHGQAAEMLGWGSMRRRFSSSVTVRISSRHGMSWNKVRKHSDRWLKHECHRRGGGRYHSIELPDHH